MKKIYLIAAMLVPGAFFSTAQDLQVSNIQYSYDFQTAVLDVTFDMDNTGSVSTFDGVVCEVSIMDLGTSEYSVGSATSGSFGLSGGFTESLSVTNIDLDNVPGLPSGDYYVNVCVDVTDIEVEDNEGNNCGQNITLFQFEALTTSVESQELGEVSATAYPNPIASNTLNFSLTSAVNENVEVVIMDATGKAVFSKEVSAENGDIQIDINDLTPGIYYYQLTTNEASLQGKLIRK